MTKQNKPAFMPIKAEHDREQPKTKTQNNRLIEHFVGGNSIRLQKQNAIQNRKKQYKTPKHSYCHLQSVQSSRNGKEVKKNGKSKSNQH